MKGIDFSQMKLTLKFASELTKLKNDTYTDGLYIKIWKHSKTEAAAQRCSVKKVLLEISKNTQENTCARVSFSTKLLTSDL